ncbi:MAG: translation initiation factor, partial [Calditrichota bacterium]
KNKTRLVYSTETGSVEKPKKSEEFQPVSDGIIRIRREVKGRGGKTVTTVSGVPGSQETLKELAAQLKRRCGTGGAVKDRIIIIQGDHRETLLKYFKENGYQVKLAGG